MSGRLHPPGTPPGVPPLPPLLTPGQATALLDQIVYEQVLECVDLDALFHVAQSLDSMVGEIISQIDRRIEGQTGGRLDGQTGGTAGDRADDLARSILDRALLRLPDDLRGYLRVSEYAAREDCFLCQAEARQAARHRGATVTATGGDRRSKRPDS